MLKSRSRILYILKLYKKYIHQEGKTAHSISRKYNLFYILRNKIFVHDLLFMQIKKTRSF